MVLLERLSATYALFISARETKNNNDLVCCRSKSTTTPKHVPVPPCCVVRHVVFCRCSEQSDN